MSACECKDLYHWMMNQQGFLINGMIVNKNNSVLCACVCGKDK